MIDKASQRLDELRRRGDPGVAPLWAEHLAAGDVLGSLSGNPAPWAVLLCAKSLAETGRVEEARRLLDMLQGLPSTLHFLKMELEAGLGRVEVRQASNRAAALEEWLRNVRAWRSAVSITGGKRGQAGASSAAPFRSGGSVS